MITFTLVLLLLIGGYVVYCSKDRSIGHLLMNLGVNWKENGLISWIKALMSGISMKTQR